MCRLSSDGVFLLENGVELYLWVGREASPAIVSALFSVPTLEGQDLSSLQMQVRNFGNSFPRPSPNKEKRTVARDLACVLELARRASLIGVFLASGPRGWKYILGERFDMCSRGHMETRHFQKVAVSGDELGQAVKFEIVVVSFVCG